MPKAKFKRYPILAAAAALAASALLVQPAAAGEGSGFDARYEAYAAAEAQGGKAVKPSAQRQTVRVGTADSAAEDRGRRTYRFSLDVSPEEEQSYRR